MNARERALDAQRKLNYFSNHENGIVWARSWRATGGAAARHAVRRTRRGAVSRRSTSCTTRRSR